MTISQNTKTNAASAQISERGNAKIITLALVLIVAVGAGVYLSGGFSAQNEEQPQTPAQEQQADNNGVETQVASLETQSGDSETEAEETAAAENTATSNTNPVVATLNGTDIKRSDLFRFMQQLSPQVKQQPLEKLYPFALEQIINNQIISQKVAEVDLDNDPMVQEQLEQAKTNIIRTVYMQKEVEKRITEKRIKKEYEDYKKTFPKMDEIKAAHILVADEEKANSLIKELDSGADFAELAKANSTDKSAVRGGELDYFTKTEVVKPFAEAAFSMKKGKYSAKPVKSEFGYHIIKMMDKRQREPVDYATAKPQIEIQLRPRVLEEVLEDWKKAAKIEKFDINGNEVEPAAGE